MKLGSARSVMALRGCLLAGATLTGATAAAAPPPSGCDDISSVAPFTQFRYEQFQAIFEALVNPKDPESHLCTSCHPGSVGAGGMGLGSGFSYDNLVGVESGQDPSILRVSPGNPLSSLLFLKLNCASPGVGNRMPQDLPALSTVQQAFFYDWIRVGAPLSRLGFEDR